MSSTATPAEQERPAVRVLRALFAVCTIAFVLLGVVIVVAQAVVLALGRGMTAVNIAEELGPWAFGLSTVAGLLAFALTYLRTPQAGEVAHE